MVDSPRDDIFGGMVAAPAFQDIGSFLTQALSIHARRARAAAPAPRSANVPRQMRLATLIEADRGRSRCGDGDPARSLAVTYGADRPWSRARCTSVCPGFAPTATTSPPRPSRAARRRWWSSGRWRSPVPQLLVRLLAGRRWPWPPTPFYGHPSRQLDVVGVTGTNGKTTTAFLLHAVLEAAGLRPGLLGTVEPRVGGQVEPVERTTPESVDLQALLRRDAGRRRPRVRDGGLVARARAGAGWPARGSPPPRFTNLTQDHLDFHPHDGGLLRGQARACSTSGRVAGGDQHRRRATAGGWPREAGGPVLTYAGCGEQADVRPHALRARRRAGRSR